MNRRPGLHAPRLPDRQFVDRVVVDDEHAGINPYVDGHRAFGRELVPAEDAPSLRGCWAENFGRQAPLHLELGTGNGSWISDISGLHPDWDWLGLEIRFKRCVQGATHLRRLGRTNARMLRYSWFALSDVIADEELTGVHVNHPDPWSSPREARHRLIDARFVSEVARMVRSGGELRLKTDFRPHIHALLAALDGQPFDVIGVSDDIKRDGAPWPDEIITGYQRKFDGRGLPVYAAWLRRR